MNQSQALQEAIFLLRKAQPKSCLNWIEKIGDCKKQECEFCRIENCIEILESKLSSSGERGDGEVVYRERIVDTDPPKSRGDYKTDLGILSFNYFGIDGGVDSEWFVPSTNKQKFPTYWFEPITLPHPSTKEFSREQKVLDALRFTWRNLNRLQDETTRQVSRRMRNSMNFRIRKVIKFVENALDEFVIKPNSPAPSSHTEVKEGREVEFAEWIIIEGYRLYEPNGMEGLFNYKDKEGRNFTTSQLFQLFLNQSFNK